jgi:putative multiple sugar transport system ATP-binding protein
MDSSPILEVNHVTKIYPKTNIAALDDVSLTVRRGEIHGIVGEVGAGKTTLMNLLCGLLPAGSYQGDFLFEGIPLALRSTRDAIKVGIAAVPRRFSVFPRLSVAENIAVGGMQAEHRFFISNSQTEREAQAVLDRWGLTLDIYAHAGDLTPIQQRLLMIARALSTNSKLIVLDEPSYGLKSPQAISQLLLMVRRLAERGITCLYVARTPSDAFQLADRVTVLRDGTVAGLWERMAFDEAAVSRAMASQRDGESVNRDEEEDRDEFGTGGILGSLNTFFDRIFRPGS